jgi:hypothetical protein
MGANSSANEANQLLKILRAQVQEGEPQPISNLGGLLGALYRPDDPGEA